MSMTVEKDALFAARLPEGEVEIPGVGAVRVRGLTRAEVFGVQNCKGVAETERKILHFGMVAPALSVAEVQRWQEACPAGELDVVVDEIRRLSGLDEGADKSGVPADGDEPDDGVRDVPGGEAGHDGGGAAGADG